MLTHSSASLRAPSRVVVLGANGFLGRGLCDSLRAAGWPVHPVAGKELDLSQSDSDKRLAGLLRASDVLVFLSCITPDRGRDSAAMMKNLAMARAVAAAASVAKPAQLVYASSDAVYSFATALISEQTPAAPADLYGAMHRARELVLAQEAPAPLTLLRFTTLYGAGDPHNSYGPNRFIRQALKDGKIPLFGGGEEMRDHLYVKDAIEILRLVIGHGSTGLLNAACGQSASFRAVADAVAQLRPGARVEPSERKSPITHRHFDPTNMIAAFPSLRFTPLAEGLRAAVAGSKA